MPIAGGIGIAKGDAHIQAVARHRLSLHRKAGPRFLNVQASKRPVLSPEKGELLDSGRAAHGL